MVKRAEIRFEWFDKYMRNVASALAVGTVKKTKTTHKKKGTT